MSHSRGILYIKWGKRLDALLGRSIQSVQKLYPELPIHVKELPENSDIMAKALMMDFSLFDQTLFLDCDTVVLSDITFGFEMAVKHKLACCISECPWARRYEALKSAGDAIEYNTGVLFFTRDAKPIFDRWKETSHQIDSRAKFLLPDDRVEVGINDQASFAYAIRELGVNPFVLPMNYNLRPMYQRGWFGPVKIWHGYDPVPNSVIQFTQQQQQLDAIIRFAKLS